MFINHIELDTQILLEWHMIPFEDVKIQPTILKENDALKVGDTNENYVKPVKQDESNEIVKDKPVESVKTDGTDGKDGKIAGPLQETKQETKQDDTVKTE
jgi:hypothetical protein